MKQKPYGFYEAARPRHEAKRTLTFPCGEATLHRAKPCFIFHARQRASLKKALACASAFFWLGWPDLNRRMPESKSGALPLGDIPIFCQKVLYHRSLSLSRIFYLTLSFTFICSAPLIFKKRLRKVEFCDIL